jgi:hypothetical protein
MCNDNTICFLLNQYLSQVSITVYTVLIKLFNALESKCTVMDNTITYHNELSSQKQKYDHVHTS